MIKLDKNYSEHVETGDPKYPFGKGVRSSGPNQFDGTPWLELLMNDIHGAKTALFKAAFGNNKDVSGNPDTVSASDFVDSLLEFVIKRKISELSACSSAELAAKISDETGTGKLVFSDTPTLNNPVVGTQAVTDNSNKAASTAFANSFLQNKLGNVPNVTTNDQTPSYSVAGSDTNLSSGEKLTTAFGKIARAVSSLLSHIGSSSNPHSATDTPTADRIAMWNSNGKLSPCSVAGNFTVDGKFYVGGVLLANILFPLNCCVMQFVGQPKPADAYGGTWTEKHTGGEFFRTTDAVGGSGLGTSQGDAFQGHRLNVTVGNTWDAISIRYDILSANAHNVQTAASSNVTSQTWADSGYGAPRQAVETRPKNVRVVLWQKTALAT